MLGGGLNMSFTDYDAPLTRKRGGLKGKAKRRTKNKAARSARRGGRR